MKSVDDPFVSKSREAEFRRASRRRRFDAVGGFGGAPIIDPPLCSSG